MNKKLNTWQERLTAVRKAKGLSMTELARRARVSLPAVSEWESSATRELSAASLLRVCRALDIDPYWLYFGRSAGSARAFGLGADGADGCDLAEARSSYAPPERDPADWGRVALALADGLTASQRSAILKRIRSQVERNREVVGELADRLPPAAPGSAPGAGGELAVDCAAD